MNWALYQSRQRKNQSQWSESEQYWLSQEVVKMLSQHIIDQLQPYGFDRLAHKEKDGRRRLRLIALAHLKDGQELC